MNAMSLAMLFVFLVAPGLASAQNTPPVAGAGPDQEVFLGTQVVLEGDASDADGNAITAWSWTIEDAPPGSTAELGFPYLQVTDFVPDLSGEYHVSLVVSDGIDWSQPDYVTVTVIEILPPVAVASADITSGSAPLVVQFNGEGSTAGPLLSIAFFSWDFGDGSSPSTAPSPLHTYEYPGPFTAVLTVGDSIGQLDSDTIGIDVTAAAPQLPTLIPAGAAVLALLLVASASYALHRGRAVHNI